jgi:hypothetical protein
MRARRTEWTYRGASGWSSNAATWFAKSGWCRSAWARSSAEAGQLGSAEDATRFIRPPEGHIWSAGYRSGQIETHARRRSSDCERDADSVGCLAFSKAIPIEAVTLSPVSIGDVFLDAAFHLADIALYRDKLLLDAYVLAQTRDSLALAGHMKLSADEAQVLDLVDERNSVGDILSASPLTEDRTLRLLLALRQAGTPP